MPYYNYYTKMNAILLYPHDVNIRKYSHKIPHAPTNRVQTNSPAQNQEIV